MAVIVDHAGLPVPRVDPELCDVGDLPARLLWTSIHVDDLEHRL
jgi:hypothetical protein